MFMLFCLHFNYKHNIMIFNLFYLNVYDLNGCNYEVPCVGNQNIIAYIKAYLNSKTNINSKQIMLYINNEELLDPLTLKDYSINEDTNLRMHFKMSSGLF